MRAMQLAVVSFSMLFLLGADRPKAPSADKDALAKLQTFVGSWRGVGQVKRGSARGAWNEESDWEWHFGKEHTALAFKSPEAKFFTVGALRWLSDKDEYELAAKKPDGETTLKYAGAIDDTGKLILLARHDDAEAPGRISLRLVAGGDRLLVLYERQSGTSKRFLRMAEVGYTRKGSNFGKGATYVECVVTGGKGTIAVTHKGQTYYVCCGGCRDYFSDDPEGVLAEYRERKAEEKKTREKESEGTNSQGTSDKSQETKLPS